VIHSVVEKLRLTVTWMVGIVFIGFVCFSRNIYSETLAYETIEMIGYALIIAAVVGRIWCSVYIAGRKDEELTTDGPYSLCRNPLYVFSFIGAVGIVLSSTHIVLLLILIPIYWGYYLHVIKSEEERLARLFGRPYDNYCRQVSSLIPDVANYWSRKNIDIKPRVLLRSIVNTTWLLWAIVLMELLEFAQGAQIGGKYLIPVIWKLPF